MGLHREVSCSSPLKARFLKSSETSSFTKFVSFPELFSPLFLSLGALWSDLSLLFVCRMASKMVRNDPGSEITGSAGTNSQPHL